MSFICFCLYKNVMLTNLYSVVLYKFQGPLDCSVVLFFGFTLLTNMRDIDHLPLWQENTLFLSQACNLWAMLTTSSWSSSQSKGFSVFRATVKLEEDKHDITSLWSTITDSLQLYVVLNEIKNAFEVLPFLFVNHWVINEQDTGFSLLTVHTLHLQSTTEQI